MNFILVALGGALGSLFRYSISLIPVKSEFPFLTLITNILGAILIGFLVGIFESKRNSSNLNLFFKTGFCGGFTTFSTFSLESHILFENKEYFLGSLYIILSLFFCILGVYFGKKLSSLIN